MQKNRALGGQASRETDGYGIDLKWQGTKSNWRRRSGLAGERRRRRERVDAQARASGHGDPVDTQIDADLLADTAEDQNNTEAIVITADGDGVHVDGCDLPRCPVCALVMVRMEVHR